MTEGARPNGSDVSLNHCFVVRNLPMSDTVSEGRLVTK